MKQTPIKTMATSSNRPRPRTRIDRLFIALHAQYGTLWADRWEGAELDIVRQYWSDKLARFDDACIAKALESLLADGATFPPTLPEFYARCQAFRPMTKAQPLQLVAPRTTAPEGIFDKLREQLRPKPGTGDDAK